MSLSLLKSVRRLFDAPVVVYECRQCGTTLEAGPTRCACCGSDDIVRYEIE